MSNDNLNEQEVDTIGADAPTLPPEAPSDKMHTLYLKKNEERRLRAGHLWVYSNEIDTERSPLKGLQPGQPVLVRAANGYIQGSGYANPASLISVRLVSRSAGESFDDANAGELILKRVQQALAMRKQLFSEPFYRLCYGESDGLPGLVVDRFGDYLSVQITTAGMDKVQPHIISALEKTCKPKGIVLRNDHPLRKLEGLSNLVEVVSGKVPEEVEVIENGATFMANLREGQKTGWYYDQAENRRDLGRWVKGKRVLDVCCYAGGWAVQAARAGAAEVWAVDSSIPALDATVANATRNNVEVTTVDGDAFEVLRALVENGEKFDVVMIDPPPFIKRKKDAAQGAEAYRRLNKLGLNLLNPGGLLISSSCSQHFSAEDLVGAIRKAGSNKRLQIVSRGGQGPDHPIHPSMPETDYLHSYFVRLLD